MLPRKLLLCRSLLNGAVSGGEVENVSVTRIIRLHSGDVAADAGHASRGIQSVFDISTRVAVARREPVPVAKSPVLPARSIVKCLPRRALRGGQGGTRTGTGCSEVGGGGMGQGNGQQQEKRGHPGSSATGYSQLCGDCVGKGRLQGGKSTNK